MDGFEQLTIWDMMQAEVEPEDVKIEGAINVRPKEGKIGPFKVTLTTGDLVLIVSMIEDYIRGLDVVRKDDLNWQVYYRKKFSDMSKRIQEQINYDYEKKYRECMKKAEKEDNSDVGEEALSLALKYQKAPKPRKDPEGKEEKAND